MRRYLLSAAALLVVATAHGDTREDGMVVVQSGMWDWRQETSVMGIPIKERNMECLIPQKARIMLSGLAADLDESCTVNTVAPAPGGYSFKLVCGGKYPGKADATISHTSNTLKLRAKGSAKMLGIPAGFSMKADATYVGECSPDEYARQQAKWEEEEARRLAGQN